MTKAKASDEGAAPQSVTGEVQGAPPPAAEPDQQQDDQKDAPTSAPPPVPAAAAQPGLPSPHQDHALNWMTEIQIKFDTFKAGHDALVAELEGKDNEYKAARKEREVQYENDVARLDDNHDQLREALQARIDNMLTGMEVARVAVGRYNELVKPETKNLRDDEQQESEQ